MSFRWRTALAGPLLLLGIFLYIGLVAWLLSYVVDALWLLLLGAVLAIAPMPWLFAGLFRFARRDPGSTLSNPD